MDTLGNWSDAESLDDEQKELAAAIFRQQVEETKGFDIPGLTALKKKKGKKGKSLSVSWADNPAPTSSSRHMTPLSYASMEIDSGCCYGLNNFMREITR